MSKTGAPRKAMNLNALRAQQADARGEKYVPFELTPEGGEEPLSFRVLRRTWWPVKFLLTVDGMAGDVDVLRALMGEEQFDLACEAGLDFSDMKAIFKEVMGRDGEDGEDSDGGPSLGESSGSSES
jgi:hypothetical protein